MVKDLIVADLKKILQNLDLSRVEPLVEHPNEELHGDYSTNITMQIARQLNGNPMELGEKIKNNYEVLRPPYIDKIEVAKPGFINFWLSQNCLIDAIGEAFKKKEKYGWGDKLVDRKIMIEFTDPNPFKEFHIGHLYSNTIGESLSRLLEAGKAEVRRASYQGDVGVHVAKAVWGMRQLKTDMPKDNDSLGKKMKFLGQAYALGDKAYQQNEAQKREIETLNEKIYKQDPQVIDLYKKGREWSLDYFEEIYKRLGTKFDYYYFESKAGEKGLQLVKDYLPTGVFQKSEGAIIFPGKDYGLHTRVFVNSQGLPTYEAKELGLAPTKYQDFPYNQSLIVTGNEIIDYFKVLLQALEKIYPDLAKKTRHIPHGMVRLPEGKMSSRTGEVITGEWLLDEVKGRILKAFPEMNQGTAEVVAVGAVKYALLRSNIGKDIIFSFEESISLEGNSGPYLQYTYARTQSVLAKVTSVKNQPIGKKLILEKEETQLLRMICRFTEIIEDAIEELAPNLLCSYLFNLAQKFNLFYQKHPILKAEGGKREFRLGLTQAVGQVIKNGLFLLGINAPEKM